MWSLITVMTKRIADRIRGEPEREVHHRVKGWSLSGWHWKRMVRKGELNPPRLLSLTLCTTGIHGVKEENRRMEGTGGDRLREPEMLLIAGMLKRRLTGNVLEEMILPT